MCECANTVVVQMRPIIVTKDSEDGLSWIYTDVCSSVSVRLFLLNSSHKHILEYKRENLRERINIFSQI